MEFFRDRRPRKLFELLTSNAEEELPDAPPMPMGPMNDDWAVGDFLLLKNPLCILGVLGDVDVEESVEPQGENGRGNGSAEAIEEEEEGEIGLLMIAERYIPEGDGKDSDGPTAVAPAGPAPFGDLDLVLILNILNKGVPDEWDLG